MDDSTLVDETLGSYRYSANNKAIDEATFKLTKAKLDIRYWTTQTEKYPHSQKAVDRLRMAEQDYQQACEARKIAREEARGEKS